MYCSLYSQKRRNRSPILRKIDASSDVKKFYDNSLIQETLCKFSTLLTVWNSNHVYYVTGNIALILYLYFFKKSAKGHHGIPCCKNFFFFLECRLMKKIYYNFILIYRIRKPWAYAVAW